ncbi:hypothetical protein TFLX_00611 [Thermoflexales bacterium]|nr:hypothetical protein TFLX_00611 [Thermoflexales bacterium]
MSVELQGVVPQLPTARIDVSINVSTTLNVTAYTAKRKANTFVLNRIGTGLFGDEPQLIVTDRLICWRVPIFVSMASRGRLGQVGQIEIDAQTGEILADDNSLKDIAANAERLVASFAL